MDDIDRKALDIAGRDYRRGGSREQAARDELDLSGVQLWARVNRLLDDESAAVECPQLVGRLRRLREVNRRQREPRRRAA